MDAGAAPERPQRRGQPSRLLLPADVAALTRAVHAEAQRGPFLSFFSPCLTPQDAQRHPARQLPAPGKFISRASAVRESPRARGRACFLLQISSKAGHDAWQAGSSSDPCPSGLGSALTRASFSKRLLRRRRADPLAGSSYANSACSGSRRCRRGCRFL